MALFRRPMVDVDLGFGGLRRQDWWFVGSACAVQPHTAAMGNLVSKSLGPAAEQKDTRAARRDWAGYSRDGQMQQDCPKRAKDTRKKASG